jgi:phosphomannomutase
MKFFLFDVDGTITESRTLITDEMIQAIRDCSYDRYGINRIYLVTGSNYEKTVEQCGDLLENIDGVFACSGNAFYVYGDRIFQNNWVPPNVVVNWLQSALGNSDYPIRTGNHVEIRPGSLNFSVVGRNAKPDQREDYRLYDLATNERRQIAFKFNKRFPHLSAKVGGDTGVDIAPIGNDKSQVYKYLAPLFAHYSFPVVHFFGDRIANGGNDEPLATILKSSLPSDDVFIYEVTGPQNTLEILKTL